MERFVVVVVLSLLLCSEQVLSFNAHGIIDPYENLLRGEEAYYDLGKRITVDDDQKVRQQSSINQTYEFNIMSDCSVSHQGKEKSSYHVDISWLDR